jgi:hypothetical protein
MPTKPVEDSVAKVNDELAVGSDLDFQHRWWRFERAVWVLFTLLVIADLLGCFGRGFLAKSRMRAADGSLDVQYERVERFSTPSILRAKFGPDAIHEGKVQLWVSSSLVKNLGNQRVIPQPAESVLDNNGILYTFATKPRSDTVAFALEPTSPGLYDLEVRVPGHEQVKARIFVVP